MTVALLQEPGWAEPLTQHNSNARHLPLVYGRKTIFCMGGLQFIVVESSKRPKGDGSETGATGGGGGWGVPRAGEHFQQVQSCRVTTAIRTHTIVWKFFITSWHNNSLVTEHVQMKSRDPNSPSGLYETHYFRKGFIWHSEKKKLLCSFQKLHDGEHYNGHVTAENMMN